MSAAGYTNRIRTKAQARVRKVQYPFSDASNYNPLLSACSASPDFTILDYSKPNCCITVPSIIRIIYDGGNAIENIYDGGSALFYNMSVFLRGSNGEFDPRYDGGNARTLPIPLLNGGSEADNYMIILDGGNFMS
jgi:hypothetical protein